MSCSVLYGTLQFQNKKEEAFKTRILSHDRSVFTGLIGSLQLSQWQEFTLYQYYRAMKMLCHGVHFIFFLTQVFQPFFQVHPICAPYLLAEAVSFHFLSTLSDIFHLISPFLLPTIPLLFAQVPCLLTNFFQFHFSGQFAHPLSFLESLSKVLVMFLQGIPYILGTGFCIRPLLCIVHGACNRIKVTLENGRETCPVFVPSACPQNGPQEHVPVIAGKLIELCESQLDHASCKQTVPVHQL